MTHELLNKLKHLAQTAAHLPSDVTLEDEDAAMKALHGELAADTVLELIALAERTTADVSALTDEQITFNRRWSLAQDGFGLQRNDETGEYVAYDDAVSVLHAALTAAPAPIQQEPEATHKRQVFMDEIDAAKAGSEWLQPFFTPNFSLCFSVDEGARAPRAKWCMLFDSLDRVVAGYMLTRDAKNWTELTKIVPHATPPTPAVSQSQAAGDAVDAARYRWLKSKGGIDERDGGYHKSYWLPRITKEGGTIDKPIYHADLDAAIDAAMREQQP